MADVLIPRDLRDPNQRLNRICDLCNVVDDAPRHLIQAIINGRVVDQIRHMDCCRQAGCPDTSCNDILTSSGEARNMDLVNHILFTWGPEQGHAPHPGLEYPDGVNGGGAVSG